MTSNTSPCDFGHYLQLNRRAKGKTLQQIAVDTKIPVYRLQQLENQELDNLPAAPFVKGFVRAYAASVGADVRDALQRFDACVAMRQQDLPASPTRKPRRPRFWGPLFLGCLLMVAVITLTLNIAPWMQHRATTIDPTPDSAAFAPSNESLPHGPGASAVQSAELSASATSRMATTRGMPATTSTGTVESRSEDLSASLPSQIKPGIAAEPAPTAPQSMSIPAKRQSEAVPAGPPAISKQVSIPKHSASRQVLRIIALETTWLQIAVDDRPSKEMTLKPEETVVLEALSHFELHIGNAGGVTLTLNDQQLGMPGRSGQVKKMRLP